MNLFRVNGFTVRLGDYTGYYVSDNEQGAKEKFIEEYGENKWFCSFEIIKITEIDGYSIIFSEKDKQINLDK